MQAARSCFPPKFSIPDSSALEFDLGGNMSIRVHTTLPVLIKVLSQVFAAKSSSFRQVDDRYPLVHTAALSAESVHFAQSRVLPCCRMWTLKIQIKRE